jgi:hypothetical protein
MVVCASTHRVSETPATLACQRLALRLLLRDLRVHRAELRFAWASLRTDDPDAITEDAPPSGRSSF